MTNGTVKGEESHIFNPGDTVTVVADSRTGYVFDGWMVDYGDVTVPDTATATFKMPYSDVELTANLVGKEYPINIIGGSAYDEDGEKITKAMIGDKVVIVAEPEKDGSGIPTQRFKKWSVTKGTEKLELGDATAEQTSFVVPADVTDAGITIQADFDQLYMLIVVNGTAKNEAGETIISQTECPVRVDDYSIIEGYAHIKLTNVGDRNLTYVLGEVKYAVAGDDTHTSVETQKVTFDTTGQELNVEPDGEVTVRVPVEGATVANLLYLEVEIARVRMTDSTEWNQSGSNYGYVAENDQITVIADEDTRSQQFTDWEFDPEIKTDLTKREITFQMPAGTQIAIANFGDYYYTVKVENGTLAELVDGKYVSTGETQAIYKPGDRVYVVASVPEGQVFDHWKTIPSGTTIDYSLSKETSFTMPYNNVTIRAAMVNEPTYPVTVIGGRILEDAVNKYEHQKDADGNDIPNVYLLPAGEEVTLIADDPATYDDGVPAQRFRNWSSTIGIARFDDSKSSETTFTMPTDSSVAGGVTITA